MPVTGNNYIVVVFDSCRYDFFIRAQPRVMHKLGPVERRWHYKKDFVRFNQDGYFGHGPILHENLLEVPFVEGKLR